MNRTAAEDAKNDPASRWRRGGFLAARLQEGDAIPGTKVSDTDDGIAEQIAAKGKMKTKTLETQHWLELIDGYAHAAVKYTFVFTLTDSYGVESIDMEATVSISSPRAF